MTSKPATTNGLGKQEADYLARIDACLREIETIQRDIVRKRIEGRKTSAEIRRQHKEIQRVLDRVEATL